MDMQISPRQLRAYAFDSNVWNLIHWRIVNAV